MLIPSDLRLVKRTVQRWVAGAYVEDVYERSEQERLMAVVRTLDRLVEQMDAVAR